MALDESSKLPLQVALEGRQVVGVKAHGSFSAQIKDIRFGGGVAADHFFFGEARAMDLKEDPANNRLLRI